MVTYSLSISPQKPHYSEQWFTTVLQFVRERSTKFIVAEECGSHSTPTHLQIALELEAEEQDAFNRTLQNRIRDLPGRGPTTKVMRKNPNAFKYVCKEMGRKVYEGFEEADIVAMAAQYAEESQAASGGNYPFLMLAKKFMKIVIREKGEELLDESVPVIAATLLADNLISFKEYGRAKNNSTIMRININRMKDRWESAVNACREETWREMCRVETVRQNVVIGHTKGGYQNVLKTPKVGNGVPYYKKEFKMSRPILEEQDVQNVVAPPIHEFEQEVAKRVGEIDIDALN